MNAGKRPVRRLGRLSVLSLQIAIIGILCAAWELLPKVDFLSERITILDPFFISSPSLVAEKLGELVEGSETASVWPYLWITLKAALLGTGIGMATGCFAGMLLSNSPRATQVLRPLLVGVNAVPRIAIVPVVVIICGPSLLASTVTAVTVVFFIVFFNAFEGGRSVSESVVWNSRIMGASQTQVMFQVRFRYVLAWTLAALPNAVGFGLLVVVTAEVLTGIPGMGRLLVNSLTTVDASLTFAIAAILAVVGIALVSLAGLVEKRLLHWWRDGASA